MTDLGWRVTPEQIEKIKRQDSEAVCRFIAENLEYLSHMAKHYCSYKHSIGRSEYSAEDCISGLYIDLPYFDFSSRTKIYFNLRLSFDYSPYGGLVKYVKDGKAVRRKVASKYLGYDLLYFTDFERENDEGEIDLTSFESKYLVCGIDHYMGRQTDDSEEINALIDSLGIHLTDKLRARLFEYLSGTKPKHLSGTKAANDNARSHAFRLLKMNAVEICKILDREDLLGEAEQIERQEKEKFRAEREKFNTARKARRQAQRASCAKNTSLNEGGSI